MTTGKSLNALLVDSQKPASKQSHMHVKQW